MNSLVKTISFINYKGGVGKTTTAYHIGCDLALRHKKRVLMVDVDPQTNLTFLCAVPERWEEFKKEHGTLASLYGAFLEGRSFDIRTILWTSPIERAGTAVVLGLDLIPSDIELLAIDLDLMTKLRASPDIRILAKDYISLRTILRRTLQAVKSEDDYDYILIDCPPNLYLVTQNALAASDSYIVTALPDHLSTIGLSILEDRIRQQNDDLSTLGRLINQEISGPTLGGIIFVRVRLGGNMIVNLHDRRIRQISQEYPDIPFENYTTEGIGYSEAAEQALPVFLMSGSNPRRVASQYSEITDEFLGRFE